MDPMKRQALQKALAGALEQVAAYLVGQAKVRATKHVNTGALRNAITHYQAGEATYLIGIPKRTVPYAIYLEMGFRPHWVPFSTAPSLAIWASRVGHPSVQGRGKYLRQIASGIYIGGPKSTLEHGPGGATGLYPGPGGIKLRTWTTLGGANPLLPPGKVGFPIIREVARTVDRDRLAALFATALKRRLNASSD